MSVSVLRHAQEKLRTAARDAILSVTLPTLGAQPKTIYDRQTRTEIDWKPSNERGLARPLRIVAHCLLACGVPQHEVDGLNPPDLARIAMGTAPSEFGLTGISASDAHYNVTGMFSNILMDAQNVILRQSYNDGKATFQQWAKQGQSLPDFKLANKVIGGEFADPKAIGEDGEFEETTLTDGKEVYQLTVFGSMLSISWQTMLNDRIGSFMEAPVKMVRSMRRKHNRLVYRELKDNRPLADGIPLFHASAVGSGGHANLTTGVVSDYAAALATMVQKLAVQRGLSADSGALNLTGMAILYPPALADKIGTLLASTVIPGGTNGTANIYEGMFTPVMDAELGAAFGGSDTAFYLVADPLDVDTVEYCYLEGLESPAIESQSSFGRLGFRQRIYQPFATKALDYRGVQKHSGA